MLAEDPAAELLALEQLLGDRGREEATLPAEAVRVAADNRSSYTLYTEEEYRPKIWHLAKNVLLRNATGAIDAGILEFVIGRMGAWDVRAWGSISPELARVKELLAAGSRGLAADFAANCHRRFAFGVAPQQVRQLLPGPQRRAIPRSKYVAILVVDDDKEFADWATSILETLAASCLSYAIEIIAATGSTAFEDATRAAAQHGGIAGLIVDWDLSSGGASAPAGTGVDLIHKLWALIPRAHACLLTGRGPLNVTREIAGSRIRPFSKADADCLEHAFAHIVSSISEREITPFFTALTAYSQRQVSTFHALAISGGRAVRKSPWLDSFFDFYGDRVFLAETSSTQPPLDSLLAPAGSIREAEARAAAVFGAQRVRFVTNGTSTANKIVHQAILKPGDTVLVDRTCHKSHHYAFVLVGARPVYLEAHPVRSRGDFLGFCQGVATEAILQALRLNPRAKMLCLTNCTFDGFVHDTTDIISRVMATLQEMLKHGVDATPPDEFVFFFDEAWFGTGRFTTEMRRFSAMEACQSFADARVYATQSTHKTMVAFRQGSMILVRDPRFSDIETSFSEAVFTHTTTSPNYSIIASLDAGRMWADLDGDRICNGAWRIAQEIRGQLQQDTIVKSAFSVLQPEELLAGTEDSGMRLDITKITLHLKHDHVTGRHVNALLLAEEDVQFNKFTNNTVLLMVTPGTTESSAAHLVVALRRLSERLAESVRQDAPKRKDPPADVFEAECTFRQDFDLRSAYFGRAPSVLSLHSLFLTELAEMLARGGDPEDCTSAGFVIPYPPGFPILVPGQVVTPAAIRYLMDLDSREIHGMPNRVRLRVWLRSAAA